jgi:hypothetical protein
MVIPCWTCYTVRPRLFLGFGKNGLLQTFPLLTSWIGVDVNTSKMLLEFKQLNQALKSHMVERI